MKNIFCLLPLLVSQAFGAISLTVDLTTHYEFENNGNDSSGNGNHSTPSGSYSYTSGRLGGSAVRINGDNSLFYSGGGYVDLPTLSTDQNDGFTVSFWATDEVIGGSPTNEEAYISFGTYEVDGYVAVNLNSSTSSVRFSIWDGTQEHIINAPVTMGTFITDWKQMAFVYEAGRFEGYIDGNSMGQLNVTRDLFPVTEAALGRHWWTTGSSARMSVTLDDVRIYDRAFSDIEVGELHTLTVVPEPKSFSFLAGLAALLFASKRKKRLG